MRLTLLTLFSITFSFVSKAQLQAAFTVDKNTGCASPGLVASFTNTTKNASASADYTWDFGNGNTSKAKNPQASYRTAQTYTVTLTVKDGSNTSVATSTITIYKNPTSDFSATPVKGCIPLTVNFTSQAQAGEGSIDRYVWDFGDGHTRSGSGLSNVANNYTVAQLSTVSLTVTNNFGCQSTAAVKTDFVETVPNVNPKFTANKTVLCSTTEAVTFTNTSTGSGTLSYVWDFGDGSGTSTDKNPVHTFSQKGIYTVKLTVNSSDGCSNTLVQSNYINVANFNTTITAPSQQICANSYVTFQGSGNPSPAFSEWYFSDNSYFNYSLNITKNFLKAGTYTAQLVNTYGACKDTARTTINVLAQPNTNGFIVINNALCGAPITVDFKDTTSDATSWAWNFDNGITSTAQSPSVNYTRDGSYYVWLNVKNAAGCSINLYKNVYIQKPNIGITYTKSTSPSGWSGCEGMSITLKASPDTSIVKYVWDFGDGSPQSTDASPEHTYPNAGKYVVKLTFTTKNGCSETISTSSYYYSTVNVYKKPVADFSVSQTTICGNTPVTFTNLSTPDNAYTHYNFGDGNGFVYSGNYSSTINYQYFKEGTYTVSMIARSGESNTGYCYDTIKKTNYITVLPPFPKIASATNTCNGTRGDVAFTQSTRLATQWEWDFGDGTTPLTLNTNQTNVTHTYTKNGSYKVIHTAISGSCAVKDSVVVHVLLKQHPQITLDAAEVCGSGQLKMTINNLDILPNYSNQNFYYYLSTIQYGDGSTFMGTTSPYYVYNTYTLFNTPYSFTLTDMANGQNGIKGITKSLYFGCADTTNIATVKIKGPTVGYQLSGSGCFKKPVILTDTSKAGGGVPIKSWYWSFGDNTFATLTTKGDTQHIYATPGSYATSLKITDADGCTASTKQYFAGSNVAQAYGPKADFYWSPSSVLPNSSATFYNSSNTYGSSNNIYEWHFSSNSKNSTTYDTYTSINQPYTIPLTDTVRLISKSVGYTCVDTIIKLVPVRNINLRFTYTANYINNNNCPPLIANFSSVTSNVTSIKWLFGDGSSAGNNPSPSHTYNKPGTYKIALIGYGYNGATDTTFDYVTVKGPFASIKTDVQQGCLPVTVTFTADSSSLKNFTWDFGDGVITQTTDTFIVHKYTSAGAYLPALILKDSAGCESTFEFSTKIISDTLAFAFKNAPLATCEGMPMAFNITKINTAITYLPNALQYHWNFGTSNAADTANTENPSFNYAIAGRYPVSLTVSSVTGCTETVKDTVDVKPIAKPTIIGPNIICEDVPTQYNATASIGGNIQWKWQFNNGKTDNNQKTALQTFKAANSPTSIAVATDLNGCKDTAYLNIAINAKPNINLSPKSAVICLGNSTQLKAEDGISYAWYPAIAISDSTAASPIVSPNTSTKYHVLVTNSKGCSNIDSLLVTVAQPFKLSIPLDTFVCEKSTVVLRTSGANSYNWINNTATLSSTTIANPIASPTTNTQYTVVGYDAYNCFTDTGKINITVKPLPTVNAGADVVLPVGTTHTFSPTVSSNVVGYKWLPATYLNCSNCLTPTSTPRSDISYVLSVNTVFGCIATDTVAITLSCSGVTLSMPTGFSPNKDERNDRFYPLGKGIKTIKHFAIFNRSGNIIFEKSNFNINDKSFGWDGKYQGLDQPIGTYIYIVEAVCDTGEVFSRNGTIVLLR